MLDSKKTGLRVKKDIADNDGRRFGHQQPDCFKLANEDRGELNDIVQRKRCPRRNARLPPFVLDELVKEGRNLETHYLKHFEDAALYSRRRPQDSDLSKPWIDNKSRSERLAQTGYRDFAMQLDVIEAHVKHHLSLWHRACGTSKGSADFRPSSANTGHSGHRDDTSTRNQIFKDVSRSFADGPSEMEFFDSKTLASLKASCAYITNDKFAFSVAFADLCMIKSAAAGAAPCTREFADMLAMPSSTRRILMQKASGL